MIDIAMFWISDCRQCIRCLPKTSYVKILISQNSKWLILVYKASELLSSRHIPPVNHQNWHMLTSQTVKMTALGSEYKVVYTYLTTTRCFDVLLNTFSHFASSNFCTWNVFLGHLVLLIFGFNVKIFQTVGIKMA